VAGISLSDPEKSEKLTPPPPPCVPALQVICNGEEVMTVSGTRAEYNVDVWSGNHPFYTGDGSNIIQDEGRLNKFKNKYEGLDWMLGGDAAAAPADDQKGE